MDPVSIKAYLRQKGHYVEVRRFVLNGGVATSLVQLRGKIRSLFTSIKNDDFTIFWIDSMMDVITIGSDEELELALVGSTARPVKLFINDKDQDIQGPSAAPGQPQPHHGVTCDNCEGSMTYEDCDYDKRLTQHLDRVMVQVPTPFSTPLNPWHKSPYHLPGPYSWEVPPFPFKMYRAPVNHATSGYPPMAFAPFIPPPVVGPGLTGLNNLFMGLGVRGGTGSNMPPAASQPHGNASANASAGASGARTQAEASNSPYHLPGPYSWEVPPFPFKMYRAPVNHATSGYPPMASAPFIPPPVVGPGLTGLNNLFMATDYLNNVRQAIASLLDPLGIDVTFKVRPKANEAQPAGQPAATATAPSTATPAPATAPAPATTPASVPVMIQPQTSQSTPVRRNSDDWTLLNHESPACRDEVAMGVVTNGASARPLTNVYPLLPKEPATAPPAVLPQTDYDLLSYYKIKYGCKDHYYYSTDEE